MGIWELIFVAVGTTLFAVVFLAMGWIWGVRYVVTHPKVVRQALARLDEKDRRKFIEGA